ncbi:MAG: hypothetical protein O6934_09785 [SAR324 cluster bacterium]|nr:hypothetical protein [SAR324 cluster bacterium]MCZ6730797.1 hypothetical protein [SAR324 cluster bacterium]
MEFLADSWFLWIILTGVSLGLVYMNRRNSRHETGFITSAEEFSFKTVLFGPRKGEGDLFIAYRFAFVFFS